MEAEISINAIAEEQRRKVEDLLRNEALPFKDLPSPLSHFWGAEDDGDLVGAIGLEIYGRSGLLRSMVVDKSHRNRGIASMLVEKLEEEAEKSGLDHVYLLTETASQYFERKGYEIIRRDEVPGELKASSEFTHVCPSTAIIMRKPVFRYK